MSDLSPSLKKMAFEYYSLKISGGEVDLSGAFSAMMDNSDRRIIHCEGRPFLFSYIEKVNDPEISDCWYVEAIRFRRACYPVLLNSKGEELPKPEIDQTLWYGEKSAFLCSPSKAALVLLQNKHGVRSLCVSEGLTSIARKFAASFAGEIRLIGLSKSVGAPANEIMKTQYVEYYTNGILNESDDKYTNCSAEWMAEQMASRDVQDLNLSKIVMAPKRYEVKNEKTKYINKIPLLRRAVDYSPIKTIGNDFPEIEFHDLNKDALIWVIERQEHELRYIPRAEIKNLLVNAWGYKPFKEGFLDVE